MAKLPQWGWSSHLRQSYLDAALSGSLALERLPDGERLLRGSNIMDPQHRSSGSYTP